MKQPQDSAETLDFYKVPRDANWLSVEVKLNSTEDKEINLISAVHKDNWNPELDLSKDKNICSIVEYFWNHH